MHPIHIDKTMIAPCGMNCGICMAYLRNKNKCNGCRAINTWNPKTRVECKIKNCQSLNSHGLEYCYQCDQYPCTLIKHIDKRYRTRYNMSMIENLNAINNNGIEEFIKVENGKWKCKSCGGAINVHKGICSTCGKQRNMETINNIELKDETIFPDDEIIKLIIGASFKYYSMLLNLFKEYGMHHEWRYYHDGKAWLCKVQKKKKTIVWMSAWPGFMQATVYVPESHLQEVYDLDISEAIKEKIRETKKVGKSKPCIFEIRNELIIKDIEKVIILKSKWK